MIRKIHTHLKLFLILAQVALLVVVVGSGIMTDNVVQIDAEKKTVASSTVCQDNKPCQVITCVDDEPCKVDNIQKENPNNPGNVGIQNEELEPGTTSDVGIQNEELEAEDDDPFFDRD